MTEVLSLEKKNTAMLTIYFQDVNDLHLHRIETTYQKNGGEDNRLKTQTNLPCVQNLEKSKGKETELCIPGNFAEVENMQSL